MTAEKKKKNSNYIGDGAYRVDRWREIKGLYFHFFLKFSITQKTFEIKWGFQIFEPENLKDVLHKLVDTLGLKKSVD